MSKIGKSHNALYIVETKGQEDLDVPLKMERLKQWCADINMVQSAVRYDYVFVDEDPDPRRFGLSRECRPKGAVGSGS